MKPKPTPEEDSQPHRLRPFLRRRILEPVVSVLRSGATPRLVAWSLSVGVAIGVNPLLGSTTLLALAVGWAFGLNLVATQIGNHLVYPLELLLFPVFVAAGSKLFRTPAIPLTRSAFAEAVRAHPWATTRLLWRWEWHALVVWAILAAAVTPLLARLLRPGLETLQRRFAARRA